MLIRTEAPADQLVIDQLLREAFETEAEANLVRSLRENGLLTLSLVACTDEGEIVGHVLFSPVYLDNEDLNWQGLAPLAVKAEYRRQGLGQQLVEQGLETLAELGYPACVVLGDPNYYQKLGFVDAAELGFHSQWSLPAGVFRALAFDDHTFAGRQGEIQYSAPFAQL